MNKKQCPVYEVGSVTRITKYNCPNKYNHVSAESAFDYERCPYCSAYPMQVEDMPVYVRKEGNVIKKGMRVFSK